MSSSTPRAAASGPCMMDVASSMASLGTFTFPTPPLILLVVVPECQQQ